MFCSVILALFGAVGAAFALPVLSAGSREAAVRTPGASQKVSTDGKLPKGAREVPSLRTASSRTWRLPSGEEVARIYAQPINRRTGRRWAKVDNTLTASTKDGFAYRNRSDTYTARLPHHAAGAVRVEGGGDWAEFTMKNAGRGARPKVTGDKITYPDAMPGVDVAYEATTEGLRETVILADASASTSFVYSLRLRPGLALRSGRSGELQITKRGKTVFSLAAPIVYDAKGRAAKGPDGRPLRYSVGGRGSQRTVRLRFDRRWLAAGDRAFPVTVDPTISYVSGSAVLNGAIQDTFIQSDTPDANYNAATFLRVGRVASPAREQRALLKFDVNNAVPQDSVVYSTQLAGYLESAANANATRVSVREAGRSWTEAATWNRHDGAGAWGTPGATFGSFTSNGVVPTSGWNQWSDLQPMAQRWVDGTSPNNGVILTAQDAAPDNEYRFTATNGTSAQVPYLQIRYDQRYGTSERYQFWHPDGSVDAGGQPDFRGTTEMPPVSVNVASGNLLVNTLDGPFSDTTPGSHPVSRSYNSTWWGVRSHGLGWTNNSSPDYSLKPNADGSVAFVGPSFAPVRFAKTGTTFAPSIEADATLKVAPDGSGEYYVTFNESGERFIFKGLNYVAKAWIDSGGTTWNYSYTVDGAGKPTTMTATGDGGAGWIKWFFDPNISWRQTTRIETSDGKTYRYGYDTVNNLTTYTAPDGKITRYDYEVTSDGETPRRLIKITNPDGAQTKFTYSGPWGRRQVASYTTRAAGASSDGPTWRFTYGSGETVVTSPTGSTTNYTWDRSMRATGSVTGANPPTLSLSGTLFANRETQLDGDASHALTVNGTDGAGQGVKSIEVLVDDVRVDYVEQACPGGGCAMTSTYTLRGGDYGQGVHVVTARVTDLGGAVRTQTFTINIEHSDSQDPFAADAGSAEPRDDGPLLADDPANPPDEGNGAISRGLTCSPGGTILEKHALEITDNVDTSQGWGFDTARAAFEAYMQQSDNTAMPVSAFTQTQNEPTEATFAARQGQNDVGIVKVKASGDTPARWNAEGLAACGSFANQPAPPPGINPSPQSECPTPSALARQFYESIFCKGFQTIDYRFSTSVPKGRRRDAIIAGGRRWNALPGALFFRGRRTGDLPQGGPGCGRTVGADPVGVITWGRMDGPINLDTKKGGFVGEAETCAFTNVQGKVDQAYAFNMRFDETERWYFRSPRGRPKRTQVDLLSVATHEFGHATGFANHLDEFRPKSYCRASVTFKQTMCSKVTIGSTRARSLGARDVRVFRGAYGR